MLEAAELGFASDPHHSLALHLDVGGAEEVHEGLDAAGLCYSHLVRIVKRQTQQGTLRVA